MSAMEPAEVSARFERCFAAGDLDGLMALYEDDAVFPTPRGTSTGHDEIRATLKAYLDSGAKLVFGESLVFMAGDLALIHTPWTMQMPDGSTAYNTFGPDPEAGAGPHTTTLVVEEPRLWSPGDPYLYQCTVELLDGPIAMDLVHTYFANIFGPPQYKELHEKIAEKFFTKLFQDDVYVGELRTRLGIKGCETQGPQDAAKALFDVIRQR